MAHAFYHAKSSARRFGGEPEDYLALHQYMDSLKAHFADARHRLVFHNSWGIFQVEQIFGVTIARASDGKIIPVRPVLEQHVLEDLRFIPTLGQCLSQIVMEPWMHRNAEPLSKSEDTNASTESGGALETITASQGGL